MGICALGFFTCTSIHDTTLPSWIDFNDAVAFVSEVLKLEPMEFLARFEQWTIVRTKGNVLHRKTHLTFIHDDQLAALRRTCNLCMLIAHSLCLKVFMSDCQLHTWKLPSNVRLQVQF
jgi:hypothetical protein